MKTMLTFGKAAYVTLLCATIVVWSVLPATSHTPTISDVLYEHAEMVAEHGHSHGLAEDLLWAAHGHGHDVVDHDHNHAVVPGPDLSQSLDIYKTVWRLSSAKANPQRIYQIKRPPRA